VAPNLTNTIVLEGITPGEEEEEEEIEPGEIHIIEVADITFRTNSAIPAPLETPADEGGRVPALQAVRLTLLYGNQVPEHQLLVAGHTDTTATPKFNFELSAFRAKSIHSLITNDVEEWREAVIAKNKVEDRQSICKYFDGYEDIESDPGPIDGVEGNMTRTATRGFQEGYNRIFNDDITEDGIWGGQTWGAVFSLYQKLLDDGLGEDVSAAELRGQLTWFSSRQMSACGESIPKDHPGADNYRSETNRRVEILFLSPEEEIEFTCCTEDGPFAETTCDRDSCPLYGLDETGQPAHNFINITEDDLVETSDVKVTLRDVFGNPIPDQAYTLEFVGGSRSGTSDGNGIVLEENVPEGEVRIILEESKYASFDLDDEPEEDVLDTFGDEEEEPIQM
jgi:hypothetical protein